MKISLKKTLALLAICAIVFAFAVLFVFISAPSIATAASGEYLSVETVNASQTATNEATEDDQTITQQFAEWWTDLANREFTVMGISFTINGILAILVCVMYQKGKSKLASTISYAAEQHKENKKQTEKYEELKSECQELKAELKQIKKTKAIESALETLDETIAAADSASAAEETEAAAKMVEPAQAIQTVAVSSRPIM